MLLMKRGVPPYVGKWAPPGGFVESGETPQMAASREIAEELGITIDPARLLPHAMGSEPSINQVYCGFTCVLDRMEELHPVPPEALDAGWFTQEDYPKHEMWEPASRFDYVRLYEQMRSGEFHFYQWTGDNVRFFGPRRNK